MSIINKKLNSPVKPILYYLFRSSKATKISKKIKILKNIINNPILDNAKILDKHLLLLHRFFTLSPNSSAFLFKGKVFSYIAKRKRYGSIFYSSCVRIMENSSPFENGNFMHCLAFINMLEGSAEKDRSSILSYVFYCSREEEGIGKVLQDASSRGCNFLTILYKRIINEDFNLEKCLIKNPDMQNIITNVSLYDKTKEKSGYNPHWWY